MEKKAIKLTKEWKMIIDKKKKISRVRIFAQWKFENQNFFLSLVVSYWKLSHENLHAPRFVGQGWNKIYEHKICVTVFWCIAYNTNDIQTSKYTSIPSIVQWRVITILQCGNFGKFNFKVLPDFDAREIINVSQWCKALKLKIKSSACK